MNTYIFNHIKTFYLELQYYVFECLQMDWLVDIHFHVEQLLLHCNLEAMTNKKIIII